MLLACTLLAFTGITGKLVALQVVDADTLTSVASHQRLRTVDLPASRGRVFDRNGRDLALTVDASTVYAQPQFVEDPEATVTKLAPLLDLSPDDLLGELISDKTFVYIARKVTPDVGERIEELHLPGIGVLQDSKRVYPNGTLAAHVLGFVRADDGKGLAGLELQHQDMLRGTAGEMLVEQDPAGRPIPGGQHSLEPPVPGSDIVTTLDINLQYKAEEALARVVEEHDAKGGEIVVMRPSTGEILAMANSPRFDPNTFWEYDDKSWRNRAVVDAYEPGSTNKVITAAAALEAGVVTPSTELNVPDRLPLCPEKTFSDSHDHPTEVMPFSEVVAVSSNVGTIKVAKELGAGRLAQAALDFGYGKPTGVGFPGETAGLVTPVDEWHCTDLGTNAIGQGVAVSVLQMASVYATIANGGVRAQPTLVSGVVDAEGEFQPADPQPETRVITEQTADRLLQILGKVVGEDGTAPVASLAGYEVAGKTGTARVPDPDARGYLPGAYIPSFIGVVPADRAEDGVVIAVTIDQPQQGGYYGGQVAGPAFKEVASYAVTRLGLPPSATPPTGAAAAEDAP